MISLKNIFVSLLVVTIFSLHPSLNKGDSPITILHYYVYGNSFDMSFKNIANYQAIKVKWSCESNVADCKELIIYENGKKLNDIPFEKGPQRLTVYYNNQLIGTLDQNKLKKAHAHNYRIKVIEGDHQIKCVGEIEGPSPGQVTQSAPIEEIVLAAY